MIIFNQMLLIRQQLSLLDFIFYCKIYIKIKNNVRIYRNSRQFKIYIYIYLFIRLFL